MSNVIAWDNSGERLTEKQIQVREHMKTGIEHFRAYLNGYNYLRKINDMPPLPFNLSSIGLFSTGNLMVKLSQIEPEYFRELMERANAN